MQKLKKMEKAGLITKFELYIGRSKYGYRLTKLGAQKLQKYNEDLTIDFNNLCGVISNRKAAHNIAVQIVLISRIVDAIKTGRTLKYATEKELSTHRDMKDFKRPDLLISTGETVVAYEVELTAKSQTEIDQALLRNQNFLESGKVSSIAYMISNQNFQTRYQNAMNNEEGVPLYEYNAKQKKAKQTGEYFKFQYKNKLSFKYVPELKDFM